ncbi:gene transfer agent family protein [Labrys sp. 22185]|uniref:gene transfer agent family protein n=1 Tax=Labrys sp. 22185 TaxID=3453888 RepID=UPI003F837F02
MADTSITRFFGDAEYPLKLTGVQIVELERLTGKGIGAIYSDALAMRFAYAEVAETLRIALIGGGMDHKRASELVAAYTLPLTPSYTLVVEVLSAAFSGPQAEAAPDDEPAISPDISNATYADAINASFNNG